MSEHEIVWDYKPTTSTATCQKCVWSAKIDKWFCTYHERNLNGSTCDQFDKKRKDIIRDWVGLY